MNKFNDEELKHIAHLLSQDINRYKKSKDILSPKHYKEHHGMLCSTLDKTKEAIKDIKEEDDE